MKGGKIRSRSTSNIRKLTGNPLMLTAIAALIVAIVAIILTSIYVGNSGDQIPALPESKLNQVLVGNATDGLSWTEGLRTGTDPSEGTIMDGGLYIQNNSLKSREAAELSRAAFEINENDYFIGIDMTSNNFVLRNFTASGTPVDVMTSKNGGKQIAFFGDVDPNAAFKVHGDFKVTGTVSTTGTPTLPEHLVTLGSLSTVARTGAINMGGYSIRNMGEPNTGTDAATKAYVDSVVTGVEWQTSVNGQSNIEPAFKENEDRYIATAMWIGLDNMVNDIMSWTGSIWEITTPREGYVLWEETSNQLLVFNGVDWVSMGGGSDHFALSGVQGGTPIEQYHLNFAQWTISSELDQSLSTTSSPSFLSLDTAFLNMSGAVNMNLNVVQNLGEPTLDSDAVTKLYADALTSNGVGLLSVSVVSQLSNMGISTFSPDTWDYLSFVDQDVSTFAAPVFTGLGLTGSLSMGGQSITSLADPLSPQDAATKWYVDSIEHDMLAGVMGGSPGDHQHVTSVVADHLTNLNQPLESSSSPSFASMTLNGPLNMGNSYISDVLDPVFDQDVATKAYVDASGGGAGSLSVNELEQLGKIDSLVIGAQQWSRLSLLDQNLGTLNSVAFGTVTTSGDMSLSNTGRVTAMADPISAQDAATKSYVDAFMFNGVNELTTGEVNQLKNIGTSVLGATTWANLSAVDQDLSTTSSASFGGLSVSGVTGFSGAMNLNSNPINNLSDPISAQDAATKNYVDLAVAGIAVEEPVLSQWVGTVAPVAPSNGDRYIALGAWASEMNDANDIMDFDGIIWTATTPTIGTEVYDQNLSTRVSWNGTVWASLSSVAHNSTTGLQGGDSGMNERYHLTLTEHGFVSIIDQDLDTSSVPSFSGLVMAGGIDMSEMGTVSNLNAPVLAKDAVTKEYVDAFVANGTGDLTAGEVNQLKTIGLTTISATQWDYLGGMDQSLGTGSVPVFSGMAMAGAIDLGANPITGLADPTLDQDAATKAYADSLVANGVNELTTVEVNQLKTIGISVIGATEWANLSGLDQQLSTFDSPAFSGALLSGDLDMNGNAVVNLVDPVLAQDAATKAYVDAATGALGGLSAAEIAQLSNIDLVTISNAQWSNVGAMDQDLATTDAPTFAGMTLSAALAMGAQRITGLSDPSAPQDAVTKLYVDSLLANGVDALSSTEIDQLANINATVISTIAWSSLASMNQSLSTTSSPTFNGMNLGNTLNMGSSRVSNLLDPVSAQDAVSKAYLESAIPGQALETNSTVEFASVKLDAGSALQPSIHFDLDTDTGFFLSGVADMRLVVGGLASFSYGATTTTSHKPLAMSGQLITGVADPVSAQDVATKAYVDATGGALTNGVGGLTLAEVNQLKNINTNTISTTQWSYLGTMTQGVGATSSPTFAGATMTAQLSMGSQKITSLADPTVPSDAATKSYVDAVSSSLANGAGDLTVAEVDQLKNIGLSTVSAVQWGHVGSMDQALATTSSVAFAGLDLALNKLTNLGAPTLGGDAVNKTYADALVSNGVNALSAGEVSQLANLDTVTVSNAQWTFLGEMTQSVASGASPTFAGLTLSGAVAMGAQKITGLGDPTLAQDAATKSYADGLVTNGVGSLTVAEVSQLSAIGLTSISSGQWDFLGSMNQSTSTAATPTFSGAALTGSLAMGTNLITGLANPVSAQDAATKAYVDALSIANGVDALTAAEVVQLANIGLNTISGTQWSFVGAMDQSLATTDAPTFGGMGLEGALDMKPGVTAYKIVNLEDPTLDQDAATKAYVDSEITGANANGTHSLTAAEVSQIANIGLTTISAPQWDYVGAMTQGVASTDVPTFAGMTLGGALAMGGFKVTGLGAPTLASDGATKSYVDAQFGNGLLGLTASEVTQLSNIDLITISNSQWAFLGGSNQGTATTNSPSFAGLTLSGALAMGTSKITGLGAPTVGTDAATKTYVDTEVSTTTANGATSLSAGIVTQLSNVGANTVSATQWGYLGGANQDLKTTDAPTFSGGTLTGVLNMSSQKIIGLADPTSAQDASTKAYVDSAVAGLNLEDPVIDQLPDASKPGAPSSGDRYIATDVWAGVGNLANDIVEWNGAIWVTTTPSIGTELYDQSLSSRVSYNGTAWAASVSVDHNTINSLQGGNGSTEYYHLTSTAHGHASAMNQSVASTATPAFAGATLSDNLLLTGTSTLTMTSGGLIMSGNGISGVADPTLAQDAATKAYVDSEIAGAGTNGAHALTAAEVSQLSAIGLTTVSSAQWGYLGAMDQSVASTDAPAFAGLTLGGALAMGASQITGLADPTLSTDASTKGYVDAQVGGAIVNGVDALTSGEVSQLANIGTDTISSVQWGYLGGSDQNVRTTDTPVFAGASLEGALDMKPGVTAYKIVNLADPTLAQDAATKAYVDGELTAANANGSHSLSASEVTQLANLDTTTVSVLQWGYLGVMNQSITTSDTPSFDGLTLSGALAMGASQITGLADPTLAQDASTKAYVDGLLSTANANGATALTTAEVDQLANIGLNTISNVQWSYLGGSDQATSTLDAPSFAGLTLGGALAMGTFMISGLGAPVSGTDATTKTYVDAEVAAAVSNGVGSLTAAEIAQLANIDLVTVSGDQWGYLGGTNQGLATTDVVGFAGASLTGNLAMGANLITGVADPVSSQDAATKVYVDTKLISSSRHTYYQGVLAVAPVPSIGDTYVASANWGVDGGNAINDIALYDGAAWSFQTPTLGQNLWHTVTEVRVTWTGSAWESHHVFDDGTTGSLSQRFAGDPTSGLFYSSGVAIQDAGVVKATFGPSISFGADLDMGVNSISNVATPVFGTHVELSNTSLYNLETLLDIFDARGSTSSQMHYFGDTDATGAVVTGSVTAPTYSFQGSQNSGMYVQYGASDILAFSVEGVLKYECGENFNKSHVALDMNSQNITSLADPTSDQHAATKSYVDLAVSTAAITFGTDLTLSGRMYLPDGANSQPSLTFTSSTTAGMFRDTAGNLRLDGGSGGTRVDLAGSGTMIMDRAAGLADQDQGILMDSHYENAQTSGRILFRHGNTDNIGFSLIGRTTQTSDYTSAGPGSAFSLVRHNGTAAGSVVFTVDRANGDMTNASNVTTFNAVDNLTKLASIGTTGSVFNNDFLVQNSGSGDDGTGVVLSSTWSLNYAAPSMHFHYNKSIGTEHSFSLDTDVTVPATPKFELNSTVANVTTNVYQYVPTDGTLYVNEAFQANGGMHGGMATFDSVVIQSGLQDGLRVKNAGGTSVFHVDLTTNVVTVRGSFRANQGNAGFPGISFHTDTNTGIYRDTDIIGFAVDGVAQLEIWDKPAADEKRAIFTNYVQAAGYSIGAAFVSGVFEDTNLGGDVTNIRGGIVGVGTPTFVTDRNVYPIEATASSVKVNQAMTFDFLDTTQTLNFKGSTGNLHGTIGISANGLYLRTIHNGSDMFFRTDGGGSFKYLSGITTTACEIGSTGGAYLAVGNTLETDSYVRMVSTASGDNHLVFNDGSDAASIDYDHTNDALSTSIGGTAVSRVTSGRTYLSGGLTMTTDVAGQKNGIMFDTTTDISDVNGSSRILFAEAHDSLTDGFAMLYDGVAGTYMPGGLANHFYLARYNSSATPVAAVSVNGVTGLLTALEGFRCDTTSTFVGHTDFSSTVTVTGILSCSSDLNMTGDIALSASGTKANPSLHFLGDTSTGFYNEPGKMITTCDGIKSLVSTTNSTMIAGSSLFVRLGDFGATNDVSDTGLNHFRVIFADAGSEHNTYLQMGDSNVDADANMHFTRIHGGSMRSANIRALHTIASGRMNVGSTSDAESDWILTVTAPGSTGTTIMKNTAASDVTLTMQTTRATNSTWTIGNDYATGDYRISESSTLADAQFTLTPNGEMSLNTSGQSGLLYVLERSGRSGGDTGAGINRGIMLGAQSNTSILHRWNIGMTRYQDIVDNTEFRMSFEALEHGSSWSQKAYLSSTGGVNTALNFTGQHRSVYKDNAVDASNVSDYKGMIVSSTGVYSTYNTNTGAVLSGKDAITINDSLPVVELVTVAKDKRVFGVISDAEDDDRTYSIGSFHVIHEKDAGDKRLHINSVGEGGIWVTDLNGAIENGDYLTSSACPGRGQRQTSEFLANYTVAKATCDCDFDLESEVYECEVIHYVEDGVAKVCKAAFIGCTYHCG